MKRRVYHLADAAGLSADVALERLQSAGYRVRTAHDQLAICDYKAALNLLAGKIVSPDAPPRTFSHSDQGYRLEASSELAPHFERQQDRGAALAARRPLPSLPPLRKRRVRHQTVHYLDTEYLLSIHNALVAMFAAENDPISPAGPKDLGLLESASHRPQTSLGGNEKYKDVISKASAFFHSMVRNHAFHNGNKRTALVALVVFLDVNGYRLEVSDVELFDFVIRTARPAERDLRGPDDEVEEIREWLSRYAVRVSDTPSSMATIEFLKAIEKAGGRYRQAGKGHSWVVWGVSDRSIKISRSTPQLTGNVVRSYLQRLGFSVGQSGIHFDEFEAGLDLDQRLIRRFRVVLKNLANA